MLLADKQTERQTNKQINTSKNTLNAIYKSVSM